MGQTLLGVRRGKGHVRPAGYIPEHKGEYASIPWHYQVAKAGKFQNVRQLLLARKAMGHPRNNYECVPGTRLWQVLVVQRHRNEQDAGK